MTSKEQLSKVKLNGKERRAIRNWLQEKKVVQKCDCPFRAVGYRPKKKTIRYGDRQILKNLSVEMRMPQCTRVCKKAFPKIGEVEREEKYLPCPCYKYDIRTVRKKARILSETPLTNGK
jgi:hypothetical protein